MESASGIPGPEVWLCHGEPCANAITSLPFTFLVENSDNSECGRVHGRKAPSANKTRPRNRPMTSSKPRATRWQVSSPTLGPDELCLPLGGSLPQATSQLSGIALHPATLLYHFLLPVGPMSPCSVSVPSAWWPFSAWRLHPPTSQAMVSICCSELPSLASTSFCGLSPGPARGPPADLPTS